MVVRAKGPTLTFMTGVLGYRVIEEDGARTRVGVHGGGPGKAIDVVEDAKAPAAMNGLGTVHHVAMSVATPEHQLQMREELLRAGARVTDVRDRCYFTSIYFREPGGILFEIATAKPGFAIDEDLDALGTALKLPPWEEPARAQIEAGLDEVVVPS
jgi:glyoxalase family protein